MMHDSGKKETRKVAWPWIKWLIEPSIDPTPINFSNVIMV